MKQQAIIKQRQVLAESTIPTYNSFKAVIVSFVQSKEISRSSKWPAPNQQFLNAHQFSKPDTNCSLRTP